MQTSFWVAKLPEHGRILTRSLGQREADPLEAGECRSCISTITREYSDLIPTQIPWNTSSTPAVSNPLLSPRPNLALQRTYQLTQSPHFLQTSTCCQVLDNGGTPILQTGVFFRSVTKSTKSPKTGVTKYTVLLEDGKTWLVYAYSPDGSGLDFTVVGNGLAQATSNFNGIIQIAKNPGGDAEVMYDAACGAYPTTAMLSGNASSVTGSYTLSFAKAGMTNTSLAMFALPHHVGSFDSNTMSAITTVQLNTTTKGVATAVVADSWTLVEELPTTMGFAPWSPTIGLAKLALSAATMAAIQNVAASEVSQNMSEQTNLNSMYYSGKVSSPFAPSTSLTTTGTRQIRRHSLHAARSRSRRIPRSSRPHKPQKLLRSLRIQHAAIPSRARNSLGWTRLLRLIRDRRLRRRLRKHILQRPSFPPRIFHLHRCRHRVSGSHLASR
jgi:hypothetical protein